MMGKNTGRREGIMPNDIPKCRITVIKRMFVQELVDAYYAEAEELGLCDAFTEGQTFLVKHPFTMPEGFCPWAWADIRQHITAIMAGANPQWIKMEGIDIAGCSDVFRPVIFKVERID
jgi:uncharacterized repeat protein (TIGR04076 family)